MLVEPSESAVEVFEVRGGERVLTLRAAPELHGPLVDCIKQMAEASAGSPEGTLTGELTLEHGAREGRGQRGEGRRRKGEGTERTIEENVPGGSITCEGGYYLGRNRHMRPFSDTIKRDEYDPGKEAPDA